jgi:hypothetical protein
MTRRRPRRGHKQTLATSRVLWEGHWWRENPGDKRENGFIDLYTAFIRHIFKVIENACALPITALLRVSSGSKMRKSHVSNSQSLLPNDRTWLVVIGAPVLGS